MINFLEQVLDRSVVFSFDKTGFKRHQKAFQKEDLDVDLSGKVCLVTGANSGMGFETSRALAKLGAKVLMLCRNREKGLEAVRTIQSENKKADVELQVLDVSDLSAIRKFANGFSESKVDVLIHNAGVLPHQRQETQDGIEVTLATQLIGPFLLTHLLLPQLLKSPQARIITVTSGGMYLQKLDLKDLQSKKKPFSGLKAYANTKRAEVVINELFAERFADSKMTFNAMHPGWADTPAVRSSIPKFWKITKLILRSPDEGADTAIWLAACQRIASENGKLWFDRREVAPHVLKRTKESADDRERLWNTCCELAGIAGKES